MPLIIGWMVVALVPVHLFGMGFDAGGWLRPCIQLVGLILFIAVGMKWKRIGKYRGWFFFLGYPIVVFGTNIIGGLF